ncbi:PH domain-containing protein [Frankia sp. CNm7]|uniref:PH domain-containing protein n=1 Tax=Frankia nepalensis TaxID=1836974 RepID=A0A937RP63_9ACTN|nr:PH domain-containing protein [Frankia nepalensis]MBL7496815.1 PH domain-containing protein [Frankia nepalensis]MBL7510974.1 PH domain-containing protein [Frankia nepalensis]MBL7524861.1 PH domain-containing protein [Frankia nepalensis]MBL7633637.1 PH domain-containing protein [Frankia nepalensis]
MGFPEDILTDDEIVVLDLHPHWIRLVRPAVCAVGVLGLAVLGVFFAPNGAAQKPLQYLVLIVAVVALVYLSVLPWLRWITTRYVITNERVLLRTGVLTRAGRDIPLVRLNDVSFQHTLFERLVGSGTLTIESAGERGQVVLASVPHVEHVHQRLYELREGSPGPTGF